MLTVSLNELRFRAYHGVLKEERVLGNDYIVDCTVEVREPNGIVTGIDQTANYHVMFNIIKTEMAIPSNLMETVCMKIADRMHQSLPLVEKVSISIRKMNPPIKDFIGNSSVKWVKEF